MSLAIDAEKATKKPPHDEVDFSSGFETQYLQEYRQAKVIHIPPPDPDLAWYRDCTSVLMVLALGVVLITGSTFLIRYIFTADPTTVVVLLVGYFVMALMFVWLEVLDKHVR